MFQNFWECNASVDGGKKIIPDVPTSYMSWQTKHVFSLCQYRKQFCQQRQRLRTRRGVLHISCTPMFYRKAAGSCQQLPAPRDRWSLVCEPLLLRWHWAPPWRGCSGRFKGLVGFNRLGCSVLIFTLFAQWLFIHGTAWGRVILCVGSGCLYTKAIIQVHEGHI